MAKKDIKGITVTKADNFSEWYTQLLTKAELIEYSPVSGCYILRPRSYAIWEKIKEYFDKLIKDDGVQNAYFPLFIPESLLNKEADHVEGFSAEVAWVTHGGNSELGERLAVRPTSETIMYDSYNKWIRSHNDLPLRLNQWCNVVRWEFKHAMPFIRSREFLWQEGHTAFATEQEATDEAHKILKFYIQTFQNMLAVPVLDGQKADTEKFAGANFTLSLETVLPNGKAIQACTSHCLGQNFSKAFDISFTNDNQEKQYVWQNSWGITTRSIGIAIMMHSDDKGLVLPPAIAQTQVVIVPILFKDTQEQVLAKVKEIANQLKEKGISVHIDDRADQSPGWKFNEWELKGVPLRMELGPRDLQNNHVMASRRDTGEKQTIKFDQISTKTPELLQQIQQDLYNKAQEHINQSIVKVTNKDQAISAIDHNKIVLAPWCEHEECEATFKEQTTAKTLNAPFEQPTLQEGTRCALCAKPAVKWYRIGRSY